MTIAGTVAAGATLELALTDGRQIFTGSTGDGLLVKDGTGALTIVVLTTSQAQVHAGTLKIGTPGDGFLSSDVEVDAAATLEFDGFNVNGYQGVISGAGAVVINSGGTARFDGDNTYTVGTTVSGSTLQLGNGTTGSIVGDVVLSDSSARLLFAHSDTVVFGGAISGAGEVIQGGGGELQLTAVNTYSGGTVIQGGVLVFFVSGVFGSGAVSIGADLRFDDAI